MNCCLSLNNFHIDVVTDGYHFQPLQGVVNVVGTADIYVSKPKVQVEPSAAAPAPEAEETTQKAAKPIENPTPPVPSKAGSRSIEQIAKDLMDKAKVRANELMETMLSPLLFAINKKYQLRVQYKKMNPRIEGEEEREQLSESNSF